MLQHTLFSWQLMISFFRSIFILINLVCIRLMLLHFSISELTSSIETSFKANSFRFLTVLLINPKHKILYKMCKENANTFLLSRNTLKSLQENDMLYPIFTNCISIHNIDDRSNSVIELHFYIISCTWFFGIASIKEDVIDIRITL